MMKFKMNKLTNILFVMLSIGCQENQHKTTDSQHQLSQYNVVWDTPSKDSNGSMPIGNGDIGLNAWVDPQGQICFYISKTDSWDENGRLVKIGKVNITTEPVIVFQGSEFKQELELQTGTIRISSMGMIGGKQVNLNFRLWVDANHPVVQLSYAGSVPLKMRANVELQKKHQIKELVYSDLMQDASNESQMRHPVFVEKDSILCGLKDKIIVSVSAIPSFKVSAGILS
jgi:hypothetical protein